jgi:hypothetical protein
MFHALVCFDGMVPYSYSAEFLRQGGFVESFCGAGNFGFGFDEFVKFAADGSGLGSYQNRGWNEKLKLLTFS